MTNHDDNLIVSAIEAAERDKLDQLAETRKKLRDEILVSIIIDKEKTEFTGEFHGSGDSGDYYIDTGNEEVDKFLIDCVEQHVTTDWCNNDGGGGDITWKVFEDKIIINTHWNEMVSNDDMVGAEF